jgi:D-alanine-D-alanine ligase
MIMKIAVLSRSRAPLGTSAGAEAVKFKKLYPEEDYKGRDDIKDALSIFEALKELGYKVELLNGEYEIFSIPERKFNIVFNVCDDGFRNDPLLEPHIPALLDIFNIPYTGNNYLTLGWRLNKARVKQYFCFHKIPTPKFQVFRTKKDKLSPELKFPLFVKPVHEDASIGIRQDSLCKNRKELKKKINYILENYNEGALVEEFIKGREFNVAVVGNEEPIALPVSEIDFSQLPKELAPIVTYNAKWDEDSIEYKKTPPVCPAKIGKRTEKLLKEMAIKCYKILGCRGYARVDFRFSDSKPYVLEVNANPDISPGAGLANAAKAHGWSYKEFIKRILDYGLEAHKKRNNQFEVGKQIKKS